MLYIYMIGLKCHAWFYNKLAIYLVANKTIREKIIAITRFSPFKWTVKKIDFEQSESVLFLSFSDMLEALKPFSQTDTKVW